MSAWSSGAVGAAIVAGVGAMVATVWIGSHVREETVVANPYEEGLRLTEGHAGGGRPGAAAAECDLGAGPCTRPLVGGGAVTLELAPRPLRTMAELRVRAYVEGARGSDEISVSFSMAGMDMGRNEVRLAPAAGARTGTAVLVRCPSGRADWIAEVRVGPPGGPVRAARFPFTVRD